MRPILLILLALAIALAGCGDDEQPDPPGGSQAQPEGTQTETGSSEEPGAQRPLRVGIGDQKPGMFADERWRELDMKITRLVTPWDAMDSKPEALAAWLAAAREAGAEPLVAFNHGLGQECPRAPCEAPSTRAYERAFKKFRERFPWVKHVTPWNEANHSTQPTGTEPKRAAAYFDVVARNCEGCTIVAADVITGSNLRGWIRDFKRAARAQPELWGLHNYSDTNRFTSDGTAAALEVLDGEVWLTETGGIYEFTTQSGRATLPADPERQARSIRHMMRLAKKFPRIRRVYVYQWQKTNPQDRFDAGLVAPDGSARPALDALRDQVGG